jgi:hypothetical protein
MASTNMTTVNLQQTGQLLTMDSLTAQETHTFQLPATQEDTFVLFINGSGQDRVLTIPAVTTVLPATREHGELTIANIVITIPAGGVCQLPPIPTAYRQTTNNTTVAFTITGAGLASGAATGVSGKAFRRVR